MIIRWWFIVNVNYFVSLFGSLKSYKSPVLLYVSPASLLLLLPFNISRLQFEQLARHLKLMLTCMCMASHLHNLPTSELYIYIALTILCFIVVANASTKIYYPCCVSHHIFIYSFNMLILLCFIDPSWWTKPSFVQAENETDGLMAVLNIFTFFLEVAEPMNRWIRESENSYKI